MLCYVGFWFPLHTGSGGSGGSSSGGSGGSSGGSGGMLNEQLSKYSASTTISLALGLYKGGKFYKHTNSTGSKAKMGFGSSALVVRS